MFKLRKYLTHDAAILVYKQTILPIFYYAGLLLISLNDGDKNELQIIQNDALRFCKGVKMLDRVSIAKVPDSVGLDLLSLEQRRQRQVLSIIVNQPSAKKCSRNKI